jgi:thiamine-phosphate pyrophosphorylase
MKLLLISTSGKSDNEPEMVTKMFEAGLQTLHLRKPKLSTRHFINYLEKIPAHFHDRIIVHSHHNLIFKFNLKGVHFTSTHLAREFKKWWFFRRLRLSGKKIIKTRTYRRLSEVYNKEEMVYDYYLIETIFNTLNNELYSGYYEQGLKAGITTSGKMFMARGGINEVTLEKAFHLGFSGVALSNMIWKAENPFNKFVELLNYCQQKGIPVE